MSSNGIFSQDSSILYTCPHAKVTSFTSSCIIKNDSINQLLNKFNSYSNSERVEANGLLKITQILERSKATFLSCGALIHPIFRNTRFWKLSDDEFILANSLMTKFYRIKLFIDNNYLLNNDLNTVLNTVCQSQFEDTLSIDLEWHDITETIPIKPLFTNFLIKDRVKVFERENSNIENIKKQNSKSVSQSSTESFQNLNSNSNSNSNSNIKQNHDSSTLSPNFNTSSIIISKNSFSNSQNQLNHSNGLIPTINQNIDVNIQNNQHHNDDNNDNDNDNDIDKDKNNLTNASFFQDADFNIPNSKSQNHSHNTSPSTIDSDNSIISFVNKHNLNSQTNNDYDIQLNNNSSYLNDSSTNLIGMQKSFSEIILSNKLILDSESESDPFYSWHSLDDLAALSVLNKKNNLVSSSKLTNKPSSYSLDEMLVDFDNIQVAAPVTPEKNITKNLYSDQTFNNSHEFSNNNFTDDININLYSNNLVVNKPNDSSSNPSIKFPFNSYSPSYPSPEKRSVCKPSVSNTQAFGFTASTPNWTEAYFPTFEEFSPDKLRHPIPNETSFNSIYSKISKNSILSPPDSRDEQSQKYFLIASSLLRNLNKNNHTLGLSHNINYFPRFGTDASNDYPLYKNTRLKQKNSSLSSDSFLDRDTNDHSIDYDSSILSLSSDDLLSSYSNSHGNSTRNNKYGSSTSSKQSSYADFCERVHGLDQIRSTNRLSVTRNGLLHNEGQEYGSSILRNTYTLGKKFLHEISSIISGRSYDN